MIDIKTLINKWITEDKLDTMEIGMKVKNWFFRTQQTTEHWLWEDDWDGGDGDDNNSSFMVEGYDDGEDEIY